MNEMITSIKLNENIEAILNFAIENLILLDQNEIYWKADDNSIFKLRDKIVIESSLLVYILNRDMNRNDNIKKLCLQATDLLKNLVSNSQTKALIHKNPQFAYILGLSYISLNAMGYVDDEYEFLIKNITRFNKFNLTEKIPFRQLDILWAFNFYNSEKLNADFPDYSFLSFATSPAYMERNDAYALTHTIMYLTDFGMSNDKIKKSEHMENIYNQLNSSLIWCITSEDFDLTSEILLAYYYCGFHENIRTKISFEILLKYWTKFSFLPSPTFVYKQYAELDELSKKAYYYRNCYHTNYVFGLCLSGYNKYKELTEKINTAEEQYFIKKQNNLLMHIKKVRESILLFLLNEFGIQSINYSEFQNSFLISELLNQLILISKQLKTDNIFVQAIEESEIAISEKIILLFESNIWLAIKNYDIELIVKMMYLLIKIKPDISENFAFQEALEFC